MRRKPVEQAEGLRSTFKSPAIAEKSKGLLETSASVSSLVGEAVVAVATGAFSSSACWEAPAFESSTFPDAGVAMLSIWRRRGKEADPTNASTNGRGDAQRWMELLLCRGAHARLLVFGRTALCL
jgi:hypothetical protein